ncbi:hypothetical protein PHYSODRAFT_516261 [Phytophthora sojae]|uniref:Necrosis inducing-like protein NPP1 type n=1 Tax=Phytophthora sojae (strain P6497) TaxID=1094619 RepID=G4ZYG9_PHYSP|nr:hypothetical protein PHYSODRAFT_516261 [Phytophthora sojae]EGZ12021.1 hypothetical protein PHYSODRAFT_516261 [Phytophthora sojae]|eukprot:XP_009532354.1 hypothetical protein PHYSODRAFT_516261 [Phytophthora sojae]
MKTTVLLAIFVAFTTAVGAGTIDHDAVQPFAQPNPVTVSEKAAVKFQPLLFVESGCVPFPAVNSAGETSGGLKGTGGTSGCKEAGATGSQVYGRAVWYKDDWAIMYAWYFPKGFWSRWASRHHDWASIVVWIDNPALETPKMIGISTSEGDNDYRTAGPDDVYETTPRLRRVLAQLFKILGDTQPLIMWEQLTDEARITLNTTDFGKAKVPMSDANFQGKLEKAWPF